MKLPQSPMALAMVMIALLGTIPASAQEQSEARVAESAVGEVGQRQTSAQLDTVSQPLGRIDNRIRNRVQSRIRNRVDRFYDPQANATSPFTVASDSARTPDQAGRRR